MTGWRTGPLERDGAAAFVHLIRDPEDPPDAAPRGAGRRGGASRNPGGLQATSVADWTVLLQEHLADGEARTFNRLSIELVGRTADVTFESNLDRALWRWVDALTVERTVDAPARVPASWTGASAPPYRAVRRRLASLRTLEFVDRERSTLGSAAWTTRAKRSIELSEERAWKTTAAAALLDAAEVARTRAAAQPVVTQAELVTAPTPETFVAVAAASRSCRELSGDVLELIVRNPDAAQRQKAPMSRLPGVVWHQDDVPQAAGEAPKPRRRRHGSLVRI